MTTSHPATYRSLGEQTTLYTNRPHDTVPKQSVNSPAAWNGTDLAANPNFWRYRLFAGKVEEIRWAVSSIMTSGIALADVSRDNFVLPALSNKVQSWRDELMSGIGVKYVTGLTVDSFTRTETEITFWGIGHHMGIPVARNPYRELLGHVKDYGESTSDPFVPLYRTSNNIRYHFDATDIVGLLCLYPAKSGGQSQIISIVTLFNGLMEERPHLVPRMFEPFRMDLRGETRPVEREILDFYDEKGLDQRLYLDMSLERGDMQFLSNHFIAHARTAYEDYDDPEMKRHLLRLWLSAA